MFCFKFLLLFVLIRTFEAAQKGGRAGRVTETCVDKHKDVPGFFNLGTYKGTTNCGQEYEKSYYIPKNIKAHWVDAAGICRSFGMDFLSLETRDEATDFLELCERNAALFGAFTHIGGITSVGKSLDEWYWINSYNRIDYVLKFGPGQPDNAWNNEYCLTIGKQAGNFHFNDIACFGAWPEKFICQKSTLSVDNLISGGDNLFLFARSDNTEQQAL